MEINKYSIIALLSLSIITNWACANVNKENVSGVGKEKIVSTTDSSASKTVNKNLNPNESRSQDNDSQISKDQFYENKEEEITPEKFGAKGDGVLRKLSTKYATIGAAQKDYPKAQDLDFSIDGAAFQKAVDYAAEKGGGIVTAAKKYAINFPIETRSNVTIDGKGSGYIYNDRSRKKTILQYAFFLGDHHGAGFTKDGQGSAHYKLYDVAGEIKAGQNFARLSNNKEASEFSVGQLILLCTVGKKVAFNNENVSLPFQITMCKIVKIQNEQLFFEFPIDEDMDDPQIAANGGFDSFAQINLGGVENVTIRDLTVDARSWAIRWYGYKCTIENINIINGSEIAVGNALAHSTIKNIAGTFSRRCLEIKTGALDLTIDGLKVSYKPGKEPPGKDPRSVISIGEYNRNIIIKNFEIDMGNLNLSEPVIGLRSRKATISDGKIYCKNQTAGVLRFYGDNTVKNAKFACYANKISNLDFYCNAAVKNYVSVGSEQSDETAPSDNIVENCNFYGGGNNTTVALLAGDNNTIRQCSFPKAKLVKKQSFAATNKIDANKF